MADNVFWRAYSRLVGPAAGPIACVQEPPQQTGALELGAAQTIGPFARDIQYLYVSSANAGLIEFGGAAVAATAASRLLPAKDDCGEEGGKWYGVMPGTYASLWDGSS